MVLKIGSTGDEVRRLQSKLGLTPDGSFGPVTEAKVKEWQALHDLKPDGIVGDITWSAMFTESSHVTGIIQPGGFNLEKLKGYIPDPVISQIPETAKRFSINNLLRLAHFLAQCAHESGEFRVVAENLNYSAERLKEIFPKYFPGNLSDSYANNPVRIASRVYASRMGNGDEESGDGYTFRGRGYIQLTGKANYKAFSKFIGEDTISNADLVSTKYPLASAAFYFDSNNIWSICDRGETAEVVTAVTKAVNGGTIGLAQRIKHFNDFFTLLK